MPTSRNSRQSAKQSRICSNQLQCFKVTPHLRVGRFVFQRTQPDAGCSNFMRSKIIASLLAVACLPMPTAGAYQVHGELDRGTGQEFCVLSASDADRAAYQTYLEEVPRAWEKLRGNLRSDFPQIDFTEYDRLPEGEREAWLALNRPVIDEAGDEHRYRSFELDLLFVDPDNPPAPEAQLNGTYEMLAEELNKERRIRREFTAQTAIYSPFWPTSGFLFLDRVPLSGHSGTSMRFRIHRLAAAEKMHPLANDVESRMSRREYTETLRACANGDVETYLVGTPRQLTSSLSS